MDLNTFSNSLKTSQPNHQKLQSFKGFQNYFEELSRDILGKITYSNRHLADEIFKFNCPKKHEKQIFKKHLYAAGSTIKRLSEEISENNISSYNYLLRRLVHDLYDIVVFGEQQFRNKILNYGFIGRIDQSAKEIYQGSNNLLRIENLNPTPNRPFLRSIIPISAFAIRQSIEVYGKKLIGFYSIMDKYGNRVRINSQIAWDFIKWDQQKSTPNIHLPIDYEIIEKIEKWTNHYVHTGIIPNIYLIENALYFIEPLFKDNKLKNFEGRIVKEGTSTITEYNKVKNEFAIFLNKKDNRHKKKQPPSVQKIVNWMPQKDVSATILS